MQRNWSIGNVLSFWIIGYHVITCSRELRVEWFNVFRNSLIFCKLHGASVALWCFCWASSVKWHVNVSSLISNMRLKAILVMALEYVDIISPSHLRYVEAGPQTIKIWSLGQFYEFLSLPFIDCCSEYKPYSCDFVLFVRSTFTLFNLVWWKEKREEKLIFEPNWISEEERKTNGVV